MGCGQSMSLTNSPSNQLQNLKMKNGYVVSKGGGGFFGHRRSTGQMLNNSDPFSRKHSGGGSGGDNTKLNDGIGTKNGSDGAGKERALLVDEEVKVVDGWPKCPLPRLRDALAHSYSGQASPRPCFSFPSCPLPLVRHLSSDQPYLPTIRRIGRPP